MTARPLSPTMRRLLADCAAGAIVRLEYHHAYDGRYWCRSDDGTIGWRVPPAVLTAAEHAGWLASGRITASGRAVLAVQEAPA